MDKLSPKNQGQVDRPTYDQNAGNQVIPPSGQGVMYPGPSFPYGSLIQPGLASQRHGLRPETQVPLGTDQSRSRLAWIVRPPLSHTYQTSDQVFSASTAQPVSQGIPIVQQNQYLPQRSQAYYSKPITQLHSYLEQPPHPQFSFLNGMATAIHVPQTSGHYLPPLNQPPPIARTQIIGKTRARNFETDPVPKKKKSRRICAEAGCKKYAQGATKRCVRHGGGRRCQTPDCTKSAAGSTPLCIAHGGGKRCSKAGCGKSAISPANLCFAHGGGKRCRVPGCSKGGRGAASLCIIHSDHSLKLS